MESGGQKKFSSRQVEQPATRKLYEALLGKPLGRISHYFSGCLRSASAALNSQYDEDMVRWMDGGTEAVDDHGKWLVELLLRAERPKGESMSDTSRIVRITVGLERFWRAAHGWAPKDAADMLAEARLDRQVSFARTLERYREPFPTGEAEALLILGYVTLRSLCEGVLKLFCAVWWEDYRKEPDVPKNKAGVPKRPAGLTFEPLIGFYCKRIDSQCEGFLRRVQTRGNAIHHFKDAKIGTQEELLSDIAEFLQFLLARNRRLPYPDDIYDPG